MQGLCASYYLLFFMVFVALWVLWFVRWRDWRMLAAIGAGCAACAIVLSPIAVEYSRVHEQFGLSRDMAEMLLTAPTQPLVASMIALWVDEPFGGIETRVPD